MPLPHLSTRLGAPLFALALTCDFADAQERGVVLLGADQILIEGEIGSATLAEFNRLHLANPSATEVILDSPGGLVFAALDIAATIQAAGMRIRILSGDRCFSVCSLVFLAGRERTAEGHLGVHQISGVDDISLAQSVLAEIYEALMLYRASEALVAHMLRAPPDGMYVFTPEEVEEYGIDIGPAGVEDAPLPHLQVLASMVSGEWLVGVFLNTHTSREFIAVESVEMSLVMRLVYYPSRNYSFIELIDLKSSRGVGDDVLMFRFGHDDDEPFMLMTPADHDELGWSFDVPSLVNPESVFWAAFAFGTDLTVIDGEDRIVGSYSLAGSQVAFNRFKDLLAASTPLR